MGIMQGSRFNYNGFIKRGLERFNIDDREVFGGVCEGWVEDIAVGGEGDE